MKRVALILTGEVERAALPDSLFRLFPGVEFVPLPKADNAESFTSAFVNLTDADRNTSNVRKQVQRMLTSLFQAKRREGFDHIILIDDVELMNDDRPERIVELVRDATRQQLAEAYPNRPDVAQQVRDKCSFHLFRTMIESYFFGDPAALLRAGVPPVRSIQVAQHLDRERFQTTDDDYLALPDGIWRDRRNKPLIGHHHHDDSELPWVITKRPPLRRWHPKRYLRYLCDRSLSDSKAYRETHEGADALRELDWRQVIQTSANQCPFLTALLDDLAEALGQPLEWLDPAQTAEPTRLKLGNAGRVLRNIV